MMTLRSVNLLTYVFVPKHTFHNRSICNCRSMYKYNHRSNANANSDATWANNNQVFEHARNTNYSEEHHRYLTNHAENPPGHTFEDCGCFRLGVMWCGC